MKEKKDLTFDEEKQIIEDYLMFTGLALGRPIGTDLSRYSRKEIKEIVESLPQEQVNFSKTLDEVINRMEKNLNKNNKANNNFEG